MAKSIPSKIDGGESPEGEREDVSVLMLAGDVASDLSTLEEGLKVLKGKFDEVVFVPGNHELWCQRGGGMENAPDSMVKLEDVMHVWKEAGVRTEPLIIQLPQQSAASTRGPRVLLLPFLSWYHADFDNEPDLPEETLEEVRIQGMRPFEASLWA